MKLSSHGINVHVWDITNCTLMLKLCRCSLAHFILGSDVKTAKRNASQELFLPVFSSLLDALLFRAQVFLFYFNFIFCSFMCVAIAIQMT